LYTIDWEAALTEKMFNKLSTSAAHRLITWTIASIWIANGLLCKVLHLVPRQELIVSGILGGIEAHGVTIAIGIAEVLMAFWVISGYESRKNAVAQIFIIILINLLEAILVPDLLLLGGANILVAFLLTSVIFYNEFVLHKKLIRERAA
jgi:hypothetical protein